MFLEELRRELVERGYDDLSPTHVNVMPMLDVDGTSAQVLATRIGISKQAAGKIVAELRRAGYVRTARDPADARARLIQFSEKGRALLDDGEKAKLAIESRWLTGLDEDSTRVLKQALAAIAEIGGSLRRDR